jgi:NSS family neurotransmitter:Na+ symporter
LEVSVSYLVDEMRYSRKKATLIMGTLVYFAAIPCALSFNVLQDVTILVQGKAFTFFDTADYLASNILLPLGGFFIVIFAGYVWGVDEVVKNLLKGDSGSVYFGNTILESSSSKKVFGFLIRYLSPILIFLVFLYQFGWI